MSFGGGGGGVLFCSWIVSRVGKAGSCHGGRGVLGEVVTVEVEVDIRR